MSAILFGSISTVADTSELQREAFNAAFREHGLDWQWDREEYRAQLDKAGGAKRIAAYAAERGQDVDAAAVHTSKSKIFQQKLGEGSISPRPGVVEVINDAKEKGYEIGLVTTTSRENITALLDALNPHVTAEAFDVITDVDSVADPKPSPAVYEFALSQLGDTAGNCTAIEDNVDGVAAATAAGLTCFAFPNVNTAGHDFAGAAAVVDELDFAKVDPAA